jgi:hypothetical protein
MLEQDRGQPGWSLGPSRVASGGDRPRVPEARGRRSLSELPDVGPHLQALRLAADVRVGSVANVAQGYRLVPIPPSSQGRTSLDLHPCSTPTPGCSLDTSTLLLRTQVARTDGLSLRPCPSPSLGLHHDSSAPRYVLIHTQVAAAEAGARSPELRDVGADLQAVRLASDSRGDRHTRS